MAELILTDEEKAVEAAAEAAAEAAWQHVHRLSCDTDRPHPWSDENDVIKDYFRHLATVIATTYLHERGDGWQPIERALRDKVYIMGWWDEGDFYQAVAWWDENLNKLGGGGWTDGTVASWGSEETAILYPTVFQELIPPPPTTDRGEGEGT